MSDIVILVGSLDRYSAAWAPFCHGMRKYWPDCPWSIYFITNELAAPCGKSLKVGGDRDWSTNTRRALECIQAPVILFMLEEYWLYEQPNTGALMEFGDIVVRGEADHVRLVSSWSKKVREKGVYEPDPRLCVFADDSVYRATTQAGFWNRDVFLALIEPNETIWDFENKGSIRSQKYGGRFLCVAEHRYIHYVLNTKDSTYRSPYASSAIRKGKWSGAARKYARDEGLEIDFSREPGDTKGVP